MLVTQNILEIGKQGPFSNLANIFILGFKRQRLAAAEILPQCALPAAVCARAGACSV